MIDRRAERLTGRKIDQGGRESMTQEERAEENKGLGRKRARETTN